MNTFIPIEVNKRLLNRLKFEVASELNSSYRSKLNTLKKPQYFGLCQKYAIARCRGKGYRVRDRFADYDVLSIIYVLGLNKFKCDEIKTAMFNPLLVFDVLKYLSIEGFFDKVPGNGIYTCTQKYEDFWLTFDEEFLKALQKFSNIQKLGKRRKKNRKLL